ncbi:hydrolase Cof [Salipaludibacillus keqinensis]|uniref:Hydrolase Cof n=1 Tax=Salipaludibacillus keqinensis TaxID=2045207 RepID=A0A323T8D2_9BACI|nr:HAD family hydrolase [Salipaludibacillus keqinensis]PYZ92068.1 hydrolase Cof [Salipaludibacillus keqinensis]
MTIRAAFIDMDGTLLTEDNQITNRNYQAIQQLKQQGVMVFLATGRQKDITFPYHQQLKLTTPMICLNGAAIYDSFSLDPLVVRPVHINTNLFHRVTHDDPCNVIIHAPEGLYCKKIDETVQSWMEESMKEPYYIGSLMKEYPQVVLKYSVRTGRRSAPFAHYFKHEAEVIEWEDGFEIVSKGVSKWSAIEYILNTYGIKKEEAIAFGDGPNDIEMIQSIGTGVAMGNGVAQLKQVADYVTGDSEEDGLAYYIEQQLIKTFSA